MAEQDTHLDEFYPFDMRGELPDFFLRKALRELGETPETREKALSELRELIRKSERNFRTDEFFLLAFLRVKKFESHRAFHLLQNFYEYKETYHDLHPIDRTLSHQIFKKEIFSILPYRDSIGRVVYVNRLRLCNPDLLSPAEVICASAVAVSMLLNDPVNQVSGAVVIMDFANIPLKLLSFVTFENTRLFLFLFLNALPIRYQAIHFINENFLLKTIYLLIQRFCTKKMKERFHFHGRNMKSLHKHIPPVILPPEYGGSLKTKELILEDEACLSACLGRGILT